MFGVDRNQLLQLRFRLREFLLFQVEGGQQPVAAIVARVFGEQLLRLLQKQFGQFQVALFIEQLPEFELVEVLVGQRGLDCHLV